MSTAWDEAADEALHPEDVADDIVPPPVPDTDAMLRGIVGEIARAAADGREVHPVAVAAAAMSWLSAEVGPDIYLPIGDVWHRANLYTLHIGRSARGGKGEALGLVQRIRRWITGNNPEAHPLGQVHSGGLSSREGLAGPIHDGFKAGKEVVPPVDDKRLWIVEPEFANVLAQGKREGNTLLPALRDVWDGGSIKPLTKNQGIWATHPHIALHGNITPGELAAKLDAKEINGGTVNRLLMVWAERTRLVALPAPTDRDLVAEFARRLEEVIRWAKGSYPSDKEGRRASLVPSAAELYQRLYPELRKPHSHGDLVAAATERRAPICLRIALLHAILDQSLTITAEHVRIGHAWAQYGAETAAYVLAGMGGQARDTEKEQKVLAFLGKQPRKEADRRALINVCFQKHIEAKTLDRVLKPLLDDGAIQRREADPRAGGRKRIIYALYRADNADNADNQQRRGRKHCGVSADNADNAPEAEPSPQDFFQSPQSPHDVRNEQKPVNAYCPQNPQSPHSAKAESADDDRVDIEL